MFNKDTDLTRNEINIPHINLKLTEWIPENQMSDDQKKEDKYFFVKGGTLIKRTYKEAWKLYWEVDSTGGERQKFLNLPNFDAEIFEEITGISLDKKKDSCNNKIVEIDGKKYKLTEIE